MLIVLYVSLMFIFAFAQDIAKQKCLEFSKEVFTTSAALTLTLTAKNTKIDECGIICSPLIVGGVNAKVKEFPHMAVIGFGKKITDDLSWECGGTLISSKAVLTAAHCQASGRSVPRKVRLGIVHLTNDSSHMDEVIVEKFVSHPDYKKPEAYSDIAIVFLSRVARFSAYIRPACLNSLDPLPYETAGATGFGKLDQYDGEGSPQLMKVDLKLISIKDCKKYVIDANTIPKGLDEEKMICAGYLEDGEKDTCQGDSGGPLHVVLKEPYCMYTVIGVTSFGKSCGTEYSPGIYTKVSAFVPWIEKMVWGST